MIREALTFDDVLLVPRKSRIFSRKDINTKTQLSKNISLNIPLVSANMDTVTEAKMARAMAEVGGIGIIHRFMSPEKEAEEVRKVKRAESVIIDDPVTVSPDYTLFDVRNVMAREGISGVLVIDDAGKLIGILTARDLLFEYDDKKPVKAVMTQKVITAFIGISLEKAKDILHKHRIEKLPLITKKGYLKGLITLKDILKRIHNPHAAKDKKGRLLVGAAVGVKEDMLSRADLAYRAGADVLVVDIAHGHNIRAINAVKKLRRVFGRKIDIIVGNIATRDAALDLAKAGVDGLKIGIGPGAACTTRIVTGVGMPQLTAIWDAARVLNRSNIPIIADGGVSTSGSFAKAIAAGASTVMVGGLLAGCKESPGEYMIENGTAYKFYRGMASYEASSDKIQIDGAIKDGFWRAPEGKSGKVPYRGDVQMVVSDLLSGLKSSMSYLGASTIPAFWKNAMFVRITEAGLKESYSHDISAI